MAKLITYFGQNQTIVAEAEMEARQPYPPQPNLRVWYPMTYVYAWVQWLLPVGTSQSHRELVAEVRIATRSERLRPSREVALGGTRSESRDSKAPPASSVLILP